MTESTERPEHPREALRLGGAALVVLGLAALLNTLPGALDGPARTATKLVLLATTIVGVFLTGLLIGHLAGAGSPSTDR